ncbi:MAG: hypothetical protein HQL38_05085 [Alphaproteobacteria bacterium]|nr:hypothetical protein [Alphaproteobacteria bacterium]
MIMCKSEATAVATVEAARFLRDADPDLPRHLPVAALASALLEIEGLATEDAFLVLLERKLREASP